MSGSLDNDPMKLRRPSMAVSLSSTVVPWLLRKTDRRGSRHHEVVFCWSDYGRVVSLHRATCAASSYTIIGDDTTGDIYLLADRSIERWRPWRKSLSPMKRVIVSQGVRRRPWWMRRSRRRPLQQCLGPRQGDPARGGSE